MTLLELTSLTDRFVAPKPVDNSRLGIKVMPWVNIQEAVDAVVSRLVSALMAAVNVPWTDFSSAPLVATPRLSAACSLMTERRTMRRGRNTILFRIIL
jgi:hypothetical protein